MKTFFILIFFTIFSCSQTVTEQKIKNFENTVGKNTTFEISGNKCVFLNENKPMNEILEPNQIELLEEQVVGLIFEQNKEYWEVFQKVAVSLISKKIVEYKKISEKLDSDSKIKKIFNEDYFLNNLQSIKNRLPEIKKKQKFYKRQYIVKGDILEINFFINDSIKNSEWENEYYTVFDGGTNYFRIMIDLKMNKIIDISINGYA